MHDKLVGYLLGALDREEVTRLERILESDSEARRQLEILRTGMAPLECDRDHVDAPERNQRGGAAASKALRDLIGGETVVQYHTGWLGQWLVVLPRSGIVGVRLRRAGTPDKPELEFGGFLGALRGLEPRKPSGGTAR